MTVLITFPHLIGYNSDSPLILNSSTAAAAAYTVI